MTHLTDTTENRTILDKNQLEIIANKTGPWYQYFQIRNLIGESVIKQNLTRHVFDFKISPNINTEIILFLDKNLILVG